MTPYNTNTLKIMNKIERLQKVITQNNITFLVDVDKTVNVNKSGKSHFHKMFKLERDNIRDFIFELYSNDIFLVNAFISVNCNINDPYINLSRQFLIHKECNYNIVSEYLYNQLENYKNSFNIDEINDDYYFLIFKYKIVKLESRKISA